MSLMEEAHARFRSAWDELRLASLVSMRLAEKTGAQEDQEFDLQLYSIYVQLETLLEEYELQ